MLILLTGPLNGGLTSMAKSVEIHAAKALPKAKQIMSVTFFNNFSQRMTLQGRSNPNATETSPSATILLGLSPPQLRLADLCECAKGGLVFLYIGTDILIRHIRHTWAFMCYCINGPYVPQSLRQLLLLLLLPLGKLLLNVWASLASSMSLLSSLICKEDICISEWTKDKGFCQSSEMDLEEMGEL